MHNTLNETLHSCISLFVQKRKLLKKITVDLFNVSRIFLKDVLSNMKKKKWCEFVKMFQNEIIVTLKNY